MDWQPRNNTIFEILMIINIFIRIHLLSFRSVQIEYNIQLSHHTTKKTPYHKNITKHTQNYKPPSHPHPPDENSVLERLRRSCSVGLYPRALTNAPTLSASNFPPIFVTIEYMLRPPSNNKMHVNIFKLEWKNRIMFLCSFSGVDCTG